MVPCVLAESEGGFLIFECNQMEILIDLSCLLYYDQGSIAVQGPLVTYMRVFLFQRTRFHANANE